jgi:serine protease
MTQSKYVGALAGFALLAGCGGGEGAPSTPESLGQGLSYEQFLSTVYQEPESGVFIVDGDRPISNEKKLREFYETYVKGGQLIVDSFNGADSKWSETQKKNITYCVSTSFGTNYNAAVAAMASAAGAWEQAGDVDFIHVSTQDGSCTASNTNVVFDVRPVNSGGQYLARAFFPGDARSVTNVLIDNDSFGSVAPWTLTGILRHELGHTLGFRHEHTRPQSGATQCFEDNNWRALTTYDARSVMHYPHCNGTQTGDLVLTALDIEGIQALYGAPGNPPPPPPPGTPTTETKSGSVARNQNVNVGSFSVVAGTEFKVVMTGSGDPDLYVQWGSAPTTSSYACRPYQTGANETCTLTVPAGTTSAHIMVRGFSASTYNLTISYTKPSGPSGPKTDTKTGSVTSGQIVDIAPYAVVPGSTFKVVMTGSGDADLYVQWGTVPGTNSYACRPYLGTSNETCTLTVPAGMTSAHVQVRGYTAASYTLTTTYTSP